MGSSNVTVTVSVLGTGTGGTSVSEGFYAAVVNANGTWTVPAGLLPVLSDGTYQITATAADSTGKVAFDTTTSELMVDHVAPTAAILDGNPNPRSAAAASVTIQFSEPIYGLSLSALSLKCNGNSVSLASATLNPTDSRTWTLGNLAGVTSASGSYVLTLTAAGSGIVDGAGNALSVNATDAWTMNAGGGSGVTTPTVSAWQNQANPADVNGDGVVDASDLAALVNMLTTAGPEVLPATVPAGSPLVDVNGDGVLNWLDVLLVQQEINSSAALAAASVQTASSQAVATAVGTSVQPATDALAVVATAVAQAQQSSAASALDQALSATSDWRTPG